MANPLLKLGVKAAVKGGKKLAKKIKTKRKSMNSTDNMTKGPIDKAIKKTKRPSINDPLPKVFNTRPGESSFEYFKRTGKLPERIKGK
jgi:hypothetical protein